MIDDMSGQMVVSSRSRIGGDTGSAEVVARQLRLRIAEGEFVPGAQLSEVRLGALLGVSRNTLREAFRLLGHERLVSHQFNRGVFVSAVTPADVVDVFAARRALQFAAVRSCGQDAPGLITATAACREATRAAADHDWSAVGSANIHFHRALVSTLNSERLNAFMGALLAELRLAFHAVGDLEQFHLPYIALNLSIVTLLREGDRVAAENTLATYLDDAEKQLLDASRLIH